MGSFSGTGEIHFSFANQWLISGGERGIRTLDTRLTYTPLAGERLQPLGHLSNFLILYYSLSRGARCSGHPALHPSGAICDVLICSWQISQPLGHLSSFIILLLFP